MAIRTGNKVKFLSPEEIEARFSDLRNSTDDGYVFKTVDLYDHMLENIDPDRVYTVKKKDSDGDIILHELPGTYPKEVLIRQKGVEV